MANTQEYKGAEERMQMEEIDGPTDKKQVDELMEAAAVPPKLAVEKTKVYKRAMWKGEAHRFADYCMQLALMTRHLNS